MQQVRTINPSIPCLPLCVMPDFIEIIAITGKNYYFSFREVDVPEGKKYFVSTLENNDIISFDMKTDKYGKLKIVEPVPKWIKQNEGLLLKAIQNHLKGLQGRT